MQDIPSSSNHFSLMTSPKLHDTPHSNIYNVQPTSDTLKSRTFPTISYSKDNFTFINKFNLQFSDLTENVTMCNLLNKKLVEQKTSYATQNNDVEKLLLLLEYD